MTDCTSCSPPSTLLLRGVDTDMLAQLLRQHRRDGGVVERIEAPVPPPPPRGAAEPGKGSLVDVVG